MLRHNLNTEALMVNIMSLSKRRNDFTDMHISYLYLIFTVCQRAFSGTSLVQPSSPHTYKLYIYSNIRLLLSLNSCFADPAVIIASVRADRWREVWTRQFDRGWLSRSRKPQCLGPESISILLKDQALMGFCIDRTLPRISPAGLGWALEHSQSTLSEKYQVTWFLMF